MFNSVCEKKNSLSCIQALDWFIINRSLWLSFANFSEKTSKASSLSWFRKAKTEFLTFQWMWRRCDDSHQGSLFSKKRYQQHFFLYRPIFISQLQGTKIRKLRLLQKFGSCCCDDGSDFDGETQKLLSKNQPYLDPELSHSRQPGIGPSVLRWPVMYVPIFWLQRLCYKLLMIFIEPAPLGNLASHLRRVLSLFFVGASKLG